METYGVTDLVLFTGRRGRKDLVRLDLVKSRLRAKLINGTGPHLRHLTGDEPRPPRRLKGSW